MLLTLLTVNDIINYYNSRSQKDKRHLELEDVSQGRWIWPTAIQSGMGYNKKVGNHIGYLHQVASRCLASQF